MYICVCVCVCVCVCMCYAYISLLILYLIRTREAFITNDSSAINLLQMSTNGSCWIRCFLANERLGDRVVGLFLLIQKKKKRILILRQNGNIDYTKEDGATNKSCWTTLGTSVKNTCDFSSTCWNSVNSR